MRIGKVGISALIKLSLYLGCILSTRFDELDLRYVVATINETFSRSFHIVYEILVRLLSNLCEYKSSDVFFQLEELVVEALYHSFPVKDGSSW